MKKKQNKLYILLALLFVSICLFLITFYTLEPDYFWHITAGKYMFKNGPINHDIFSWFVSGKYWMSHEWLFEVILYSFKLLFGKLHTVVYCFITLFSLLSIIFVYNRKNLIKNIPYTLIYLTTFVIIALNFVQARPHMISYSFIALTIAFSYDLYKNENSKKIYFLPLIAILWSNIHGGSSNLSYIFIGMFLFSGLFNFKFKYLETDKLTKKQIYKYLLVIILCIIGICINIHGVKMLIYPYENILDTTMINNISEWKSTSLTNIFDYSYFIFIVIISIFMLLGSRKLRLIDALLLISTLVLGIKSVRFWLYCPIVMSFTIFDYFEERKLDKGTYAIISLIIIVLIGFFIFNIKKLSNIKYKMFITDKTVEAIKKENPKRLFNMYDYGGELIYNGIPVFVDGRADLYSKYNLKDYFDMTSFNGPYEELIKKYDFDYMLVGKVYDLNDYMVDNEDYEVVFKNKILVLYKKTVN